MANVRQDQLTEQSTPVGFDDYWGNMQLSDSGEQLKVNARNLPFQPRSNRAAWVFDNSTADSDPLAGNLRFNSVTQDSTTFLYISKTDSAGFGWGSDLLNTPIGHIFNVEESGNRFKGFETSGVVVDGGNYVKVPVTLSLAGQDIRNGAGVLVGGVENAQAEANNVNNFLVVKDASDLSGTLDSAKTYFIDGKIDMGSTEIIVPIGGLTLVGTSIENCGLYSSASSYIMFKSIDAPTGSGNLFMTDMFISVDGSGSQVYELYDATGFNAIELNRVNYNVCTSLGNLHGYRQGLEVGTGRFGGSPSLTLHGAWLGGFRVTTSITRNMDDATTEPLFKAGTAFTMQSRFLSDMNVDLGTLQPFLDFVSTNFPNAGTLQLQGCEVTRDGAYNAEDSNITPNIGRADLASYWKRNNGLPNTYVGGTALIVSQATTTISTLGAYEMVAGTWAGNELEHFSASVDGKLTHLGINPREFEVSMNLVVEGGNSVEVSVQFFKYDDSTATEIPLAYTVQTRPTNNFVGGRDVAYFFNLVGLTLDQNDQLYMKVANNTDVTNVTVENGSFFRLQER